MFAVRVMTGTPPILHSQRHWRHFVVNIISPAVLTFALFLGLIFVVMIPTMKRNIIERKRDMIHELTQAAWSHLATLHQQEQQGALTRAAAQQSAIAHIHDLRYGDDRKDYFWISDTQTRMVMHPFRPDLNGQSLLDYADPAGKKLFAEFTRVVRERGEGYVNYLWPSKDDQNRVVPKLSYVKGFAPWGWIVGTGIYLEDVQTEINRMIRRVLQVSVGISLIVAALLAYISKQGHLLERRRWRAEIALRESEEKYRMLVEGAADGILLVLHDLPVYANQALLHRLGYSVEELPLVPLDKIIEAAPIAPPLVPAAERRARLVGKDGTTTEVFLSSVPVKIGDKTGHILSINDAARRRRTEDTLARLVADLQGMLPLATRSIKASPLSLATCTLETPIQEAAAVMARTGSSAILVQSPTGAPIGIVTDQDLRNRVLAARHPPTQDVASIMSAPLVRIQDRALLFEGAHLMQTRNVQHLVVTDDRGVARGILAANEILHAQRHAIGLLLAEIHKAQSPDELRDGRARLPVFVKALLESGARVESVTRIMTAVSDAILVRLIVLAEAELGPPPAPFAFLVLGSEAREEQTLATDQDNAILYADVASEQNEIVQQYFLQLGAKVCGWLDLVGYRRCQGEVMACNRKWCQPMSEWCRYFTECVAAAKPQDLLDVNVFFDFRCAHGDADLVRQLREHLHRLLDGENRNTFLFHLARSTLQFKAPRGFFGNIQVESSGAHPSAFNIKAAIIPIAGFARMYALQHRFAETNTLDRLRRLHEQGLLLPSSHDELAQAFTTLMQMRLANQAAQISRGTSPDNFIDLRQLTQLDRSVLKKVFADIAVFQARLQTDFARTA